MVATASSSGLVKSSSQWACGYSTASSLLIRRARRVSASEDSGSSCTAGRRVGLTGLAARPTASPAGSVTVFVTPASLLGHNVNAMIGFLVLLFPVLLMAFMLIMERIEVPLTRVAAKDREVQQFLDNANPEELDTLVREGTDSALRRFRSRLRFPRARRRG